MSIATDGCVHISGGLLYQKCALVIESDLFFWVGLIKNISDLPPTQDSSGK